MQKTYDDFVASRDLTPLEITLENGAVHTGMFTEWRIDRNTLPKGKYAYDISHADEDWSDLCQLQPFVLVNHAGTLVTDDPVPNATEGPIITEWSYLQ